MPTHMLAPAIDMMRTWSCAITIADNAAPDCPLVFVNQAFETLTGYSAAEIVGRNCRFLQGKDTDPRVVQELGDAVRGRRGFSGCLRNYRKDGTGFDNMLFIVPMATTNSAELTLGLQYQVMPGVERHALEAHQAMIAEVVGGLSRLLGGLGAMVDNGHTLDPTSAEQIIGRYYRQRQPLI